MTNEEIEAECERLIATSWKNAGDVEVIATEGDVILNAWSEGNAELMTARIIHGRAHDAVLAALRMLAGESVELSDEERTAIGILRNRTNRNGEGMSPAGVAEIMAIMDECTGVQAALRNSTE